MTNPTIAAIIIGIDGWERYTKPLIESLNQHEPECVVTVVDNASATLYPDDIDARLIHTERMCYSAAINIGWRHCPPSDWYIVLSNDVLCTGPFAEKLARYGDGDLVGPLIKEIDIERVGKVHYIEGWAVFIPRQIWDTIGGWDEGMKISSYEDVEYSHRARVNGFGLIEDTDLPFIHLDQKQRFYLVPDYWSSEHHNRARFVEKYGAK